MKIAVGADHRGFALKEQIKAVISRLGHDTLDVGTSAESPAVDYPDFGLQVARAVATGKADYGINVCWTGNGMVIAANKVRGVRAALALSVDMAGLARRHNDANVLTVAEKYTPPDQLEPIIRTFLETAFEGGRHKVRVEKISLAEADSDVPVKH